MISAARVVLHQLQKALWGEQQQQQQLLLLLLLLQQTSRQQHFA